MKFSKLRLNNVIRPVISLFLAVLLLVPALISVSFANAQSTNNYNDSRKYRNDSLIVKLESNTDLVLDNSGNFAAKSTGSQFKASALNGVLSQAGKQKTEKLVRSQANPSPAAVTFAESLKNYYLINVTPKSDIQSEIGKIAMLESVEIVYPVSRPTPAPTTNNYTSLQKYLNIAPEGIGATHAKSVPGGNGSAVRIFDLEYSWNTSHEDLTKATGKLLNNGTPKDPFNDNNHGTAVLGELIANDNSYGVTGAASGAAIGMVNTYNDERGWDIVGALQVAAQNAAAGDVVLLEQQTWAPSSVGGYAPVEWEPAIYDAIKAITNSGINVVEAAGNSGHNLDDINVWGSSFPMGKVHSGAVIAGAGSACSAPLRSRMSFSNYGNRVELQGYGECVTTTGYGALEGLSPNGYYTSGFNGTSSASPIVAASIASLSSAYETLNPGKVLTPTQVRNTLIQTGTPQNLGSGTLSGHIGPLPNLESALATITQAADTTAPTTPVLKGTVVKNKPKLTWTAANDNVAVKEYWIYRNGVYLGKTISLTYTDSAVARRTKYSYYIVAVDTSNNKSTASNTVSLTTK